MHTGTLITQPRMLVTERDLFSHPGCPPRDATRRTPETEGSSAVCGKTSPTLVIPVLSPRNPLAASSEAADSSRDNAALRNDNSLWISNTPLRYRMPPRLPLRRHGKLNR